MSAATDFKLNGDRIVNTALDKLGRAGALELTRRVVLRTPVRSGRARANWNPSLDSQDPATTESTDQQRALSRTGGVVNRFRISRGDVFFLVNALPYAERLENGWSRQAPNGMVRITELEMKSWLEAEARRLNRG